MQIVSVTMRDFMGFKHVQLDIPNQPMFIIGENRDQASQRSNGSGKTAFIQGVMWCLFDQLRPGTLKSEIINHAAEWCLVMVEMYHDGKHIVVTRYRNHPDHGNGVKLVIDGDDKSGQTDGSTNAKIEKHIGMTSRVFRKCALADDDESNLPFAALTPAKMLQVVSEILNLDRFTDYDRSAKDHTKVVSDELTTKTERYAGLMQKRDFIEKKIEEAIASIDTFAVEQKAEIEQHRKKIEKYQAETAVLKQKIDDEADTVAEYNAFDVGLIEQRDKLSKAVAKASDVVRKKREALSEIEQKMATEAEKVSSLQAAYDNLTDGGDDCDYCGGLLAQSPKLMEKIKSYEKELFKYTDRLDKQAARKIKAESEVKKANKTLNELGRQLSEAETALDTYRSLKKTVDEVQRWRIQINTNSEFINAANDAIAKIKKQKKTQFVDAKNKLQDDLADVEDKLDSLSAELVDIEQEKEAVQLLRDALKKIKLGVMNGFVVNLLEQIQKNLDEITLGDFEVDLEMKGDSIQFLFANSKRLGTYSTFSKGERCRIAKAVQVALAQVTEASVLIDDEGFAGLDPAGVPSLIDFMIDAGMRNVWLVSHDVAVADYLSQYPTLKIIREDDVSTAEIV